MKKKGKNTKTTITSKKKKSLIHLGVHVTWMPLSPFHMNSVNACLNKSISRFDAHVQSVTDSLQKGEFTWLLGRKKPENHSQ